MSLTTRARSECWPAVRVGCAPRVGAWPKTIIWRLWPSLVRWHLKPFSSLHCFSHIWQYQRSFCRPLALIRLAICSTRLASAQTVPANCRLQVPSSIVQRQASMCRRTEIGSGLPATVIAVRRHRPIYKVRKAESRGSRLTALGDMKSFLPILAAEKAPSRCETSRAHFSRQRPTTGQTYRIRRRAVSDLRKCVSKHRAPVSWRPAARLCSASRMWPEKPSG